MGNNISTCYSEKRLLLRFLRNILNWKKLSSIIRKKKVCIIMLNLLILIRNIVFLIN